MLSRLHRQGRRELGEVMVAGTPNLEIQPVKRALAHSAVVMAGCGREQWVRHHTPSIVYKQKRSLLRDLLAGNRLLPAPL
jgi:hypothetical protein